MSGQGSAYLEQKFNWNQLPPPRTDETWIEQWHDDADLTPLLETLLGILDNTPGSRYQLEDFKAIGLDKAFENLKNDCFDHSKLWLHDSDGDTGRKYNGVMDISKAKRCLRRKRFREDGIPDASVRRFDMDHPTAESLGILILNATDSELPLLRDFFWDHIRGQNSQAFIRFNIGVGGRSFSLTYQIPTFKLYLGRVIHEDHRPKDGKSWRKTKILRFLSTITDSDTGPWPVLQEVQHSLMVHGHNHNVWTSVSLHDTYMYANDGENPDTLEYYRCDREEDANQETSPYYPSYEMDPSTLGTIEAKKVSQFGPGDYFLGILFARLGEWYEDAWVALDLMQKWDSNYEEQKEPVVTAPMSRESAEKAIKDFGESRQCLKEAIDLLGLLTTNLEAQIQAWQSFRSRDLKHIPETPKLGTSVLQIDNKVKQLQDVVSLFKRLDNRCRHRRKDLELDINVQSGPVIALQYLNFTFVQLIGPAVASAAILQAQISSPKQISSFFLFCLVFYGLSWVIEPHSNWLPLLSRKIVGAVRGAFSKLRDLDERLLPAAMWDEGIQRFVRRVSRIWSASRGPDQWQDADNQRDDFRPLPHSPPPHSPLHRPRLDRVVGRAEDGWELEDVGQRRSDIGEYPSRLDQVVGRAEME